MAGYDFANVVDYDRAVEMACAVVENARDGEKLRDFCPSEIQITEARQMKYILGRRGERGGLRLPIRDIRI